MENGKLKKYKLGEIANIIVGYPFESEKFNIESKGVRLVRGMNVSERYLRFGEDSRWWSDLTDDLLPYYLKENDIVIGMDGSKVGRNFAIVNKNDLPLILVQRVACIRAKENFNQKFIWQYISSSRFLEYVNTIKTGSAIPHISGSQIADFPIFAPPLESQQKIVAVLSALDDKIALNRRMNAKLEQMAKRLYDHWFVQFDFPNADGKPYKASGGKMEYNEVLKREIPAGWEVKSIFDACDLLYGFPYATEPFDEDDLTASKKPYKIVRNRDIQNNSYSAKTTEKVDDKYRTRINDLLIGMDGYFHMNFWSRNDDYINQRIVRLRKTCISTLILYFQIMPFIKFKEEKAKGSTVGHLSDKDLKQLFVLIPND